MVRYCSLVYLLVVFVVSFTQISCSGQNSWPSTSWYNATNISSALPASASELSGMYWNNLTNRLYIIGDGGSVYILQYNIISSQYTLLGSSDNINSPEGITQVDNSLNEFYTIDEKSYEIRKYTYDSNFSSITFEKSWYILQSPSPMTDTGNTGPEGIAFVPDSYLKRVGFVSSTTGKVYCSIKGMGGLIFIAHQDGGYVWVFDVNPNVNNDFAYIGKYKTNRSESCETTFDSSTGLLYILHNVDDNYLEVTDLTTTIVSGEYKFNTEKEYFIPNPSGTTSVEGFALSPKYPENSSLGVWLCRDVSKKSEIMDALRWFNPFSADGTEIVTNNSTVSTDFDTFTISPNPVRETLTIKTSISGKYSIKIYSSLGQLVLVKEDLHALESINMKDIKSGIYLVMIYCNNQSRLKTIIKI